jgi:phosphate transport system permease protein
MNAIVMTPARIAAARLPPSPPGQWPRHRLAVCRRRVRPGIPRLDPVDHCCQQGPGPPEPALFTQDQPPPLEEGGLRNAIVGSLMMCGMGVAIGTPLGIAAGTWLAEVGNASQARHGGALRQRHPAVGAVDRARPVRLCPRRAADRRQLLGHRPVRWRWRSSRCRWWCAPPTRCCAWCRSQMREAALSLGVPQWKVTVQVLYRSALPGIVTGVLLALARITGETAPLLFTAFSNSSSARRHRARWRVPLVMFQFADERLTRTGMHLAWAGAFVVTLFVLAEPHSRAPSCCATRFPR